jgi:Bacterial PH domain
MKQAIAGVVSPEEKEVTVAIVWPSIAAFSIGRFLGQLYSIKAGFYIFRLGNLLALASVPLALPLYFIKVLPVVGKRFRLTNRRLIVERGLTGKEERSVELDRFNQIDVVVRPGQAWFDAGDLVFRKDKTETFRIEGISRVEPFRQMCLKSARAYTSVKQAMSRELASTVHA